MKQLKQFCLTAICCGMLLGITAMSVSAANTYVRGDANGDGKITVADVTVNYPNKGTITVESNVDGKYSISVNDKEYEVIVVDGVGTFDVTEELNVGTYDIEWDIAATENYTGATGSAVYKVDKTAPEFSLIGEEEYNYGDAIEIGISINDDASGYVSFTLDSEDAGTIDVKGISLDEIKKTVNLINNMIVGTPIDEISSKLEFEVKPIIGRYVKEHERLYNVFYNVFNNFTNKNVDVMGRSNILKLPEFSNIDRVRNVLEKFDENIESIVEETDDKDINIYIGKETNIEDDMTVIRTKYKTDKEEGTIAIVGPKRMEYDRVVNLLEYIKENIERKWPWYLWIKKKKIRKNKQM